MSIKVKKKKKVTVYSGGVYTGTVRDVGLKCGKRRRSGGKSVQTKYYTRLFAYIYGK